MTFVLSFYFHMLRDHAMKNKQETVLSTFEPTSNVNHSRDVCYLDA